MIWRRHSSPKRPSGSRPNEHPRWPWTHSTASTTASPTRMVVTPPTAGNDSVELPAQPALPPEAIPSSRSYSGRTSSSPAPAVNSRSCRSRRRRRTTASATSASGSADWRRPSPPIAAIDLYGRLPLDAAEDSVRIKLSRTCGELGRIAAAATVRRRGRYVRPGHTDHDARPDRVSEPARVPLRIGCKRCSRRTSVTRKPARPRWADHGRTEGRRAEGRRAQLRAAAVVRDRPRISDATAYRLRRTGRAKGSRGGGSCRTPIARSTYAATIPTVARGRVPERARVPAPARLLLPRYAAGPVRGPSGP